MADNSRIEGELCTLLRCKKAELVEVTQKLLTDLDDRREKVAELESRLRTIHDGYAPSSETI